MDNVEIPIGTFPMNVGFAVVTFLVNTNRGLQAMMLGEECLNFIKSDELKSKSGFRFTMKINTLMCLAAFMASNYTSAERYAKELMYHATGDTTVEGMITYMLGVIYQRQNEFEKAEQYYQKAVDMTKCTADKETEERCYLALGNLYYSRWEYLKAKNCFEKALAIIVSYGDRIKEATIYGGLGTVVQSLGEYNKAEKYYKKALEIRKKTGDRKGEAAEYGNLGILFLSRGEYEKAKEYTEKALPIRKETGDRKGEAADYKNLGSLFHSLGEYEKANEYTEKALAIRKEIGDREGEATDYGDLGVLFHSLGEYEKANEYFEKALTIRKEIGDRKGEAAAYGNLGSSFHSLFEYEKSKEYSEKALTISKGIGDRQGEAVVYGNLGTLFKSLGEYEKAKEYTMKAIAIRKEVGDRKGEEAGYDNLGALFYSLGEYEKAKEYAEKALVISKEIGDRKREADDHANLGKSFFSLKKFDKAEVHFSEAISICKVVGHNMSEFKALCGLTVLKMTQCNFREAILYLLQSIEKFDKLRNLVKANDRFKILLMEEHSAFPYELLSRLISLAGYPELSLYVEEHRRARALADLITAQFPAKQAQISGDPQSLFGIHDIIKREANCTFVYLSVDDEDVWIWILKTNGQILFPLKKGMDSDSFGDAGSVPNPKVLFSESFRHFAIPPTENYEDRSLNDEPVLKLSGDVGRSPLSHDETEDMKTRLRVFYKLVIAPVVDVLKEPEIIIVPDSCMYQVPFAALLDEGGRYLSDKFRIRIVPSLTVLKLFQDSPSNYHSKTGALIVGEPEVSVVIYRGKQQILDPLPAARKEAEMIGKMLGVLPLLGKDATKEAVLEQMKSVALIHFAAHGNRDRGEIALSPVSTTNSTPQEEEYLLTMADVSKVQLRAKLVVLSCCHSGCGEIKVEGVIGIARAFLGSGARSVLVARWALDDESTEQFMKCFYEHLFRGESASESLHEVRKWMRGNPKYSDMMKWAPFMLIGDNVTLR